MILSMLAKRASATGLVDRLFYQPTGQIVISAVFGLAIAFLFQKACTGNKCFIIQSPPEDQLDAVHKHPDKNECYQYKSQYVECSASQ